MLVTEAVATTLTKLGRAAARRDATLRGHSRTLAQSRVRRLTHRLNARYLVPICANPVAGEFRMRVPYGRGRLAAVGHVREPDRAVVVNAVAVDGIRQVKAQAERFRRRTCRHRLGVPHECYADQGDDGHGEYCQNQALRHDTIFAAETSASCLP
jgi:hypothetical protein